MFNVFGNDSSRLILPTKTSSFSCASLGIGYLRLAGSSTTMIPCVAASNSFTSVTSKSFSNSMFTDSEWPPITGIRTVVAVTLILLSLMIF
ncbi:hypothetical protein D3C80_1535790 [compost metagenome]